MLSPIIHVIVTNRSKIQHLDVIALPNLRSTSSSKSLNHLQTTSTSPLCNRLEWVDKCIMRLLIEFISNEQNDTDSGQFKLIHINSHCIIIQSFRLIHHASQHNIRASPYLHRLTNTSSNACGWCVYSSYFYPLTCSKKRKKCKPNQNITSAWPSLTQLNWC